MSARSVPRFCSLSALLSLIALSLGWDFSAGADSGVALPVAELLPPQPPLQPVGIAPATESVFINEIHYDNIGTDAGEAIEIAGPAGTDLSGWSLVLYNGSGGASYSTVSLGGTLTDQCNGFGTTVVNYPVNGIQNGSPDGIALVANASSVVQFLSYEGSFTAVGGPADGLVSTDIGVNEPSDSPAGNSLQLSGSGTLYGHFTWNAPALASFGAINAGQNFNGSCDSEPVISKIHEVQGGGADVVPGSYTVEAVVIGDFQRSDQLSGFFIQEEDNDTDADPATSEGIFVFCGSCPVDVLLGDQVRVSGGASDFFGMSELSATGATSVEILGSGQPLPVPAPIDLPVPVTAVADPVAAADEINAFFEPLEGMLVRFGDTLTVDEYFQLARFGHLVLSEGPRPRQFTDTNPPDAIGLAQHLVDLASRRVLLDDGDNIQNSPLVNGTPVFHPVPGFSVDHFVRGGATIDGLTGVLHWSWAGFSGTDAWRVRPVPAAFAYSFTDSNPRAGEPPAVGGSLKIASFNVLNYFTTLDEPGASCGPVPQDCRGADSASELERQTEKLKSAICAIDADVLGLIELENNAAASLSELVDALSASCGPYAFIDTGPVGVDAIKVGFIYKPGTVTPLGDFAVLDAPGFVDPNNIGSAQNRPALAQAFAEIASGGRVTVVVNHLKSKSSGCGAGDDTTTTGQGNCNLTRALAAQALLDWLALDPTGTGTEKVLIIGDLNSYREA